MFYQTPRRRLSSSVTEQRRRQSQIDRLVAELNNNPDLLARTRRWANVAPTLPPNIVVNFARYGVEPDSRLGKWVIDQGQLFTTSSRIIRTDRPNRHSDPEAVYAFLIDRHRAQVLAERANKKQTVEELEKEPVEKLVNYNPEQLERLIRGKDPTPEPGGIGGFFHNVGDIATTGFRGGSAVLQSGYELTEMGIREALFLGEESLQGAGPRTIAGESLIDSEIDWGTASERHDLGQITLVQMLRGADAGSGFFPRGEAAERQAEAVRAAGTIRDTGQGVTLGRYVAANITDPGSRAYNVTSGIIDFAKALYADPANYALGGIGKAGQARKLLVPDDLGAVDGLRRFTQPQRFSQWADSFTGQRTIQALADETSFSKIYDATKGAFGSELTAWVSMAREPETVRYLLEGAVNAGRLDTVPHLSLGTRLLGRQIRRTPRLLTDRVSRGNIANIADPDDLVSKLRSEFDSARVYSKFADLKPPVDDPDLARLADLTLSERADLALTRAAILASGEDVRRGLVELMENAGASPRTIGAATDVLAANDMYADVVKVADSVLADAIAVGAGLGNSPAAKRRLATALTRWRGRAEEDKLRAVFSTAEEPLVKSPTLVVGGETVKLDGPFLTNELLTNGIPTLSGRELATLTNRFRPVLESAPVRYATAAADFITSKVFKPWVLTTLSYPLTVMMDEQARMTASGYDSMFHHPLSYFAAVIGHKKGRDLLGEKWVDQIDDMQSTFRAAMTRPGGVLREQAEYAYSKFYATFRRGTDGYEGAWVDSLARLSADPVGREVARALTGKVTLDSVKTRFFEGGLQRYRQQLVDAKLWGGRSANLAQRAWSDAYIDEVAGQISELAQNNPELIRLVASRKGIKRAGDANRVFRDAINRLNLEGPELVHGPRIVGKQTQGAYDRAIEAIFQVIGSMPTNKFSRSPTFIQSYWKHVDRLTPFADDATRELLLTRTRRGFDRARRGLDSLPPAGRVTSGPGLGLEDIDELAKASALVDTKTLLYDLNRRGQVADALRLVFPFGEAFKEVTTTWARLAFKENPQVIRRVQQGWRAAEGGEVPLIERDPYGELVLVVPFSEYLTRPLVGAPVKIKLGLRSLNVVARGAPGLGPVLQIPLAATLPNTSALDSFKDNFLFPYGEPEKSLDAFRSFLPDWMRTALVAMDFGSPKNQRVRANRMLDMISYYASTGAYNLGSPEDLSRMVSDAAEATEKLYWFETFLRGVSPLNPRQVPLVADKNERLLEIQVLRDHLERLAQARGGDYDAAMLDMMEIYGDTIYMALVPRAERRTIAPLVVTREADRWRERHSEFANAFPQVYAFFAPTGGQFYGPAYERSFERGEAIMPRPGEFMRRANAQVARTIYQSKREMLPVNLNDEQRAWLAEWREYLEDEFEGFAAEPGFSEKQRRAAVSSLFEAAKHSDVRNSTLAKTIREYEKLRDAALEEAKRRGYSTLRSKSVDDLRAWLREWGEYYADERPEFLPVWDFLLGPEVAVRRDELEEK